MLQNGFHLSALGVHAFLFTGVRVGTGRLQNRIPLHGLLVLTVVGAGVCDAGQWIMCLRAKRSEKIVHDGRSKRTTYCQSACPDLRPSSYCFKHE